MKEIILDRKNSLDYDMQYGSDPSIKGKWKEIMLIDDRDQRNAAIDKLIDLMEANSENNGFISSDQELVIYPNLNCSIYPDDREIYYMFFDNLKQMYNFYEGKNTSYIYSEAIQMTLHDYFGDHKVDYQKRHDLTRIKEGPDGKMKNPSIKVLKGQDCAACVENSAISHNLWLIAGQESYFINNPMVKHTYNIVKIGGKTTLLYDYSRNSIGELHFDPIEKIRNNETVAIDDFIYHDPDHMPQTNNTNTNDHDPKTK